MRFCFISLQTRLNKFVFQSYQSEIRVLVQLALKALRSFTSCNWKYFAKSDRQHANKINQHLNHFNFYLPSTQIKIGISFLLLLLLHLVKLVAAGDSSCWLSVVLADWLAASSCWQQTNSSVFVSYAKKYRHTHQRHTESARGGHARSIGRSAFKCVVCCAGNKLTKATMQLVSYKFSSHVVRTNTRTHPLPTHTHATHEVVGGNLRVRIKLKLYFK